MLTYLVARGGHLANEQVSEQNAPQDMSATRRSRVLEKFSVGETFRLDAQDVRL